MCICSPDQSQELSPSSGRRRKPSQKVLEAEEDNKVVDEVISRKKPATPATEGKTKKAAVVKSDSKTRKSRSSVDITKAEPSASDTAPEQKETKVFLAEVQL